MSMSKEVQCALGSVHTNPFSNENRAVLLRIRLSSTLQRRIPSPKTEPFENALHSGAIWKRCFLKTLFSSVDGENDAIWKRCYLKTVTSSKEIRAGARPLDHEYPKWGTDATMWLQFRANFEGQYIEMRMRRLYLTMRVTMRTEGTELKNDCACHQFARENWGWQGETIATYKWNGGIFEKMKSAEGL